MDCVCRVFEEDVRKAGMSLALVRSFGLDSHARPVRSMSRVWPHAEFRVFSFIWCEELASRSTPKVKYIVSFQTSPLISMHASRTTCHAVACRCLSFGLPGLVSVPGVGLLLLQEWKAFVEASARSSPALKPSP